MQFRFATALSVVSLALLGACSTPNVGASARAELLARSGSAVAGTVSFSETDGRLRVVANVTGLTPGEHGFHVHEVGDCSAPDGTSAKGHFNPGGNAHGHFASGDHHGGDLPSLLANAQGVARYIAELRGLSLRGPTGVIGRSVVIHADADDYTSQPAGNSGRRVACGVIVAY
ncbi:MAG: superoxide dismutase family protein [Gammaproteobacteria bacterium]|nr:superoxide dismutase family protein [Gammaproteobacteria bacterium]MBU1601637.1 superoxide dismutase family protein [Gammaproteobacteria bacterium]MBU2434715.1 superoxide dismutase family protein [Gammaproteobacteria bacterium]MBU2447956.1 superoxide dismutase family protein [Gammaproteobacteria bacterium]